MYDIWHKFPDRLRFDVDNRYTSAYYLVHEKLSYWKSNLWCMLFGVLIIENRIDKRIITGDILLMLSLTFC